MNKENLEFIEICGNIKQFNIIYNYFLIFLKIHKNNPYQSIEFMIIIKYSYLIY